MSIKYSLPDSGQAAFCFCLLQRLIDQTLQQAGFSKINFGILIRLIFKRHPQLNAVFDDFPVFNPHIQFLDFRNSDFLQAFRSRFNRLFGGIFS